MVTNKPDTSKKQGSYSSHSYTIKAEQGDVKFKERIPIP